MIVTNGINKDYEHCKQSVRNALRELKCARRELALAYECEEEELTGMGGLIEDVSRELAHLEKHHQ